MNYAEIKNYDIANGYGVRVSLFVSGCTHHCKNCFNSIAWDFNYGKPFTDETIDHIIGLLKPDYIAGITLLGGEPMEPSNQQGLLPLLKRIREVYGDKKSIWCYTGFVLDDNLMLGRAQCQYTAPMLELIDVLVDGPFVEDLKDITLKFRGSSNQRVIDVPRTLASGKIKLYLE